MGGGGEARRGEGQKIVIQIQQDFIFHASNVDSNAVKAVNLVDHTCLIQIQVNPLINQLVTTFRLSRLCFKD